MINYDQFVIPSSNNGDFQSAYTLKESWHFWKEWGGHIFLPGMQHGAESLLSAVFERAPSKPRVSKKSCPLTHKLLNISKDLFQKILNDPVGTSTLRRRISLSAYQSTSQVCCITCAVAIMGRCYSYRTWWSLKFSLLSSRVLLLKRLRNLWTGLCWQKTAVLGKHFRKNVVCGTKMHKFNWNVSIFYVYIIVYIYIYIELMCMICARARLLERIRVAKICRRKDHFNRCFTLCVCPTQSATPDTSLTSHRISIPERSA